MAKKRPVSQDTSSTSPDSTGKQPAPPPDPIPKAPAKAAKASGPKNTGKDGNRQAAIRQEDRDPGYCEDRDGCGDEQAETPGEDQEFSGARAAGGGADTCTAG